MRLSKLLIILILFASYKASAERFPFRKTDKGPYGTYVLYDQLPTLFPSATFTICYSPAGKLKNTYGGGEGYFVVAPFTEFSKEDISALKSFVDRGNVLFISTYFLDNKIEDWLGVKTSPIFMRGREMDSISIANFGTGTIDNFFLGKSYKSYISKYDSTATDFQLLGKYANGDVNSISFKKGGGYVVLHTQPYMFSNYHLIKKQTTGYTELFFSALPGPLSSIYWDESTKSEDRGEMEALGFIMRQPPLRNAFFWALAGLLLLVLFSMKRKQRVIPVLSPLVNNSVDMVTTVSDMYYFSRKNEVIAKKKIAHWLEFLRTRHNIFTNQSPDQFWQAIKLRLGITDEKLTELREMVEAYRNGEYQVNDAELIRLNNLIDGSYKS